MHARPGSDLEAQSSGAFAETSRWRCCSCWRNVRRQSTQVLGEISPSALKKQVRERLQSLSILLSDEDEEASLSELLQYKLEKLMSYSRRALFYVFLLVVFLLVILLGSMWYGAQVFEEPSWNSRRLDSEEKSMHRALKAAGSNSAEDSSSGEPLGHSFRYSIFLAFQVLLSAGYTEEIDGACTIITYMITMALGLFAVSVLIGMVTEEFMDLVTSIRAGKLKAVEQNHTLVLGWNECTVRLVCQLAFLRRQWQMTNESWSQRIFWWTRVQPSTIVAKAPIVVLCNTKTKAEMEQAIQHAFAERGINKRFTRLGYDVICRRGNPTDVQDLQRVGAHHAAAIVVHADPEDTTHDVSISTLLALRFVLYTCRNDTPWDTLRVAVETNHHCNVLETAAFGAPGSGRQVVRVLDLSININSLLFACMGQRGMSQVHMGLLTFETAAIKFREAKSFHKGGENLLGRTVADASFVWEDAVLVGVRPAGCAYGSEVQADDGKGLIHSGLPRSGLLPEPSYVIQPDDIVLFLCKFGLPHLAARDDDNDELIDFFEAGRRSQTCSTEIGEEHVPCQENCTLGVAQHVNLAVKKFKALAEISVLICGWRDEWNHPDKFFCILKGIGADARQNMILHFLCMKPAEEFYRSMEQVASRSEGCILPVTDIADGDIEWEMKAPGDTARNVKIMFSTGDPSQYEVLEKVMNRGYNEAVITPPRDRLNLGPVASDRWATRVILMLRHFADKLQQKPIHIVCENALDATMKLAMVSPVCREGVGQHQELHQEFVNVQAIRAMALCQVVAYPDMHMVLKDLYSKDTGSPKIVLVGVSLFGLEGLTTTFRTVAKTVKLASLGDGSDVCLGFRLKSGELHMPPEMSLSQRFELGDSLIVLTRHASTEHDYEEKVVTAIRERARSSRRKGGIASHCVGENISTTGSSRRFHTFAQVVPCLSSRARSLPGRSFTGGSSPSLVERPASDPVLVPSPPASAPSSLPGCVGNPPAKEDV